MTDPPRGRDRLRELLDAVLDEDHSTLREMADGAHSSPHHFSRLLARQAGEPPVAMRRRVVLERAAWQLRHGGSVTDAAWAAGYDSVEGFSRAFARAFGHPPGRAAGADARSHWLPAPNGIHFHPPASLWVHTEERTVDPLTDQLVRHDLDDTRHLLQLAAALSVEDYRRARAAGRTVLSFDGPEESLAAVLEHHVFSKEVWVAAIEGHDHPPREGDDPAALVARHDAVAPRWLAVVRDVGRRGAWDDRIVDALCDPPESFVLSGVVAHVLEFGAHRRQAARELLRAAGAVVDHGDPLEWLDRRNGGTR